MLSGKSAIVTGSTSGIGLGIARALAGNGANVMLNGFGDADEIERTRQDLAADNNVKVIYSKANIAMPGEIAEMIEMADQQLGGVDILSTMPVFSTSRRSKNFRSRSGMPSSPSICPARFTRRDWLSRE